MSFFARSLLGLSLLFSLPAQAQEGDRPVPPPIPEQTWIGTLTVIAGQTLSFQVSCSDPLGSNVVMAANPLPLGASYSQSLNTADFSWPTTVNQVGVYAVDFSCANSAGFSTDELVTIRVVPATGGVALVRPIGPFAIEEMSLLTFRVSCLAPPPSPALTASSLPSGASFTDNQDGTADFFWVPTSGQSGGYSVTVSCTDGASTDSEVVVIDVGDVNAPPDVVVPDPLVAALGETFTYTFVATDPEGGNVTFLAVTLPPRTTLSPGGVLIHQADELGAFPLEFLVSDDGTPSASRFVSTTLVVEDCGDCAPELRPIALQSVSEGSFLGFTLELVRPEMGIVFEAQGLPRGATLDPAAGTFAFTPDFEQAGDYLLTFSAHDAAGLSSSPLYVDLRVADVNRAPALEPIDDVRVGAGEPVAFTAHATDPDGDRVTYSIDPADLGTLDAITGDFVWQPPEDFSGSMELRITASDSKSPPASDSIVVKVTRDGGLIEELDQSGCSCRAHAGTKDRWTLLLLVSLLLLARARIERAPRLQATLQSSARECGSQATIEPKQTR